MRNEKNTDVLKIDCLPEYLKMMMEKKAKKLGITLNEAYCQALAFFCKEG